MAKYAMPSWLLLVDPGKLTGIALVKVQDGTPRVMWSDETDPEQTGDLVAQVCREHRDLRVVCESFTITPQTGKNSNAPWSLELIGVVKYLCRVYGHAPPVLQSPSAAKQFCDNVRLKRVGFWHRGGDGHARDALRHGVMHLVDCGWLPENL